MIDPLRHMEVFDPDMFGRSRVDVIGCGATGSRIAVSLAKLGVTSIHIWDFDKVEEHNVANQMFGNDHVGQQKVAALADIIMTQTGTEVEAHDEEVDGSQPLGEYVFLLTDTMKSRKEIWEKGIRFRPFIKLMVETRMGADNGRVYAVNPCSPSHKDEWEGTLYDDEEAEVSACGASTTVGPTAEIISGMAVWQFIKFYRWSQEGGDEPEHEVLFSLKPFTIISRQF